MFYLLGVSQRDTMGSFHRLSWALREAESAWNGKRNASSALSNLCPPPACNSAKVSSSPACHSSAQ